ncbi:hypothetical protein C8F04DRAFT_1395304 [Mycena alexandri]|uniref:Uncharacterized protein n=1 Tax=Mycena alexandri TaxID=1745969 RepID=A0AAD6SX90_9AGAR|nr:hypothetical protein C8F04DRAFT_1395304 [Mycena alexandri]
MTRYLGERRLLYFWQGYVESGGRALATHELWNTMHLNLRPHSVSKVAPLLEFWVPRAGNLPLLMSLVFKVGNADNSGALDALNNLIRNYARHWTSVELHVSMPDLTRLKSLRRIPMPHQGELLHFLTLPALQRLELDLHSQRQITHFTSLITRSSCFLRRLSVRLGPHWERDEFVQVLLTLDSLEGLEVWQTMRSLDAAFAVLKDEPRMLPNLRSLSVERTMPDEEDAVLLADFLESRWKIPAGISLPVQLKLFKLDSPLTPPAADGKDREALYRLARLRAAGMDLRITSSHESWFSPGLCLAAYNPDVQQKP